MKRTLILLIAALLPISAIACDNNCWLNANAQILIEIAPILRANPELAAIVDEICEQGQPLTTRQRNVSQRFGFHNPIQCRRPTPTPTPHATPTSTPRVSPTPTSTPVQSPTPTPTPSASSTPTPRPSPTPSPHIRPTPTPTPTATPVVSPTPTPTGTPKPSPTSTPTPSASPTVTPGCVWARYWWCHPELWCFETLQLGNVTYTADEVFQIVQGQPNNNGLIILAKQLVSAKLNTQCNHAEGDCIRQTINDADFLIGDLVIPPIGDGFLTQGQVNNILAVLMNYNQGRACAPPCADPPCELPTPTP